MKVLLVGGASFDPRGPIEHDYIAAILYRGLCEELGNSNVLDFPPNRHYHGPLNENEGCIYPWLEPLEPNNRSTLSEDPSQFDLVVTSPKQMACDALNNMISRFGREAISKLVLADGEDHTGVRWDLVEQFHPSVYFKVSYVDHPFELENLGHPAFALCNKNRAAGISRIVPFAMASTTREIKPVEKTIDVCLFGGNHWHGERREWVREDRPLQKPIYEAALRQAFASHKIETGMLNYDEYIDKTNHSKIAVVLGGHGLEPLRTYEAMSCPGTMVVRAENAHIAPGPLIHGTHCATFNNSVDNMIAHVRFYLEHDDERKRVAANGYALVKEHYTPITRAKHLLSEAFK